MSDRSAWSLVADIGGTNTRVALAKGGTLVDGSACRFRNAEYDGLVPLLRDYIDTTGCSIPQAAALAMAGPVTEGRGTLTNLAWDLDVHILAEATGANTVALLNDLQAQGHALGHLPANALQTVLDGKAAAPMATQLVVGIGTGFNVAPVYYTGSDRIVAPSEAGHATLPARCMQDLDLAAFITERHGFCSIEDVLSGRGLGWVYDFLSERDGSPSQAKSSEVMALLDAPGTPGHARANEALGVFIRIAAGVCSDLALTLLPFGGIFLAGGMSRAITPHMPAHGFADAFRDKGRFSTFLRDFTITTITDDDAALIGSARHLTALAAHRP